MKYLIGFIFGIMCSMAFAQDDNIIAHLKSIEAFVNAGGRAPDGSHHELLVDNDGRVICHKD